ncbi:hypothetical protein M378DRAFT_157375 [Amanita muscaria Koide BX008]|uniref:Uncharacterized protein n=1 Tax=Amanita muscaria (strain Koide BX008) TaxID=946122 RepID=A0A0C2T032_AMAMK|nr:hypothetical protein M378DRAFT_157375 [Amanita muscaria Koide BX008]
MSSAVGPPWINNTVLWSLQPAVFFGLYSASFIHCVRWLLFEDEGWRIRKKLNWTLVTTTLLVFFLSTALFCAVPMQVIYTGSSFGGPIQDSSIVGNSPYYLALATLDSSVIQWSILMVMDSVMILRCWIVFSKNWFVICFPVVMWCFCLICAILSFCCYVEIPGLFDVVSSDSTLHLCFKPFMNIMPPLAFYVCNIVINIYTTSALVYKIWRAVKNNVGTNHLYRICRILTESGILYTLSSLVYLTSWIRLYFTYSKMDVIWPLLYTDPAATLILLPVGFQIVLGLTMFIPGIAFNLVIIRIGEQRATEEDIWVDSRETSEVLTPLDLLNHPDSSTPLEVESTDIGQERRERMVVMEIDRTEAGEIIEVSNVRDLPGIV